VRREIADGLTEPPAPAAPPDAPNLLELAADPASLLLEIGAAGDFSRLAVRYRRQLTGLKFLAVAGEDSPLSFARAVASAWSAGAPVVWPGPGADGGFRVPLPGYAFDRRRYELSPAGEPVKRQASAAVADRDVEEILRDLWYDYFGAERPSPEDNFFEYGADSVSVATLARVLSRLFKISIAMADLYAAPAFEDQVRLVRDGLGAAEAAEPAA
jgi:acyl transferase domain-containing protein